MKLYRHILKSVFFLLALNCFGDETIKLSVGSGKIEGSLKVAESLQKTPVALIISGSGPTDRDGNNPMMQNDSLKMLAEQLHKNGISSLRYDKRGIGKSKKAGGKEADLRFEHYANDATAWITLLSKDSRFSDVYVIGHSEGALLGLLASQNDGIAKYISVAGVGRSADNVLRDQLETQPKMVKDIAFPIIDKLSRGQLVSDINPMLNSIFRPSVQPYMISWFKYDPVKEIAKLDIPILIIQGTTDLQVQKLDAELLSKASPNSKLVVIEGMNHVLKEAPSDKTKNMLTYANPSLPLKPELVDSIVKFLSNKK